MERTLIRLISHDGSANYLKATKKENEFKLVTQYDSIRCCNDDNGIIFVDPSGGPLIAVGDHVPVFDPDMREKTVDKIVSAKKGFIITIK